MLDFTAAGQLDQVRHDANRQLDDTGTALVTEVAKVSTPAGTAIQQAQALPPPV